MQKPFSWDDLRLVLAIARSGNLAAAAATLALNHSTLFRRLNALERDLGSKLFERLGTGYRATAAGTRMIEAAERMEAEALALDRDLTGRDARLSGQLRVTCSDTIAQGVLTGEIARFRVTHPGIEIDLVVDNRVVDLSRREADVALRVTRPSQGDLFGRKLNDIRWALYASKSYLKKQPAPKRTADLAAHSVIGWVDARTRAADWLAANVPSPAMQIRTSGPVNQFVAAREGLGIALLPTYLANGSELDRVLGPLKDLTTELWIVTHKSLKDTARVRAFMELAGEGVKRKIAARQ